MKHQKSGNSNRSFTPFLILETCVALNFNNKFGSPFKLYSSLKHEGYFVTGSGFKLKLMIDRPQLHSHVTFYAKDPDGKRKILLNWQPSVSEKVVSGCEFKDVTVTPEGNESLNTEFDCVYLMTNYYLIADKKASLVVLNFALVN